MDKEQSVFRHMSVDETINQVAILVITLGDDDEVIVTTPQLTA